MTAFFHDGKYSLDDQGNAKNKNSDRDTSEKSLEDKIKIAKQNAVKGN